MKTVTSDRGFTFNLGQCAVRPTVGWRISQSSNIQPRTWFAIQTNTFIHPGDGRVANVEFRDDVSFGNSVEVTPHQVRELLLEGHTSAEWNNARVTLLVTEEGGLKMTFTNGPITRCVMFHGFQPASYEFIKHAVTKESDYFDQHFERLEEVTLSKEDYEAVRPFLEKFVSVNLGEY